MVFIKETSHALLCRLVFDGKIKFVGGLVVLVPRLLVDLVTDDRVAT